MALRLLAAEHTTGHILRLRMYIDEFRKAAQGGAGPRELAELLFDYHLYIALKSGNTVIPMVLNGFHDVSLAFWQMWIRQTGTEEAALFLERFTAFIAANDGDAAMALYRESAAAFMAGAFGDAGSI